MWLESPERSHLEVYSCALSWHGFGAYAASNICQLLGHYQLIPCDTETVRHIKEQHGMVTHNGASGSRSNGKNINKGKVTSAVDKIYHDYGDYRFMGFWMELWEFYTKLTGLSHMSELSIDHYKLFTATSMAKTSTTTSNEEKRSSKEEH